MKITLNSTIRLDKKRIGCFLAYVYIFTSYIAQDLLLSSSINSLCLYIFLAFSAYVFISRINTYKSLPVFLCWYLLFGVASCLIALYSPSFTSVSSGLYAMFVAFCLCLFLQMYVRTDTEFNRLAWCYAISGFTFVMLLFFTGNLEGDAENRLGQELLGNANIFAMMMMVAAMYTMWLLVYKAENLSTKTLLLVMIIIDIYALMLSGGRKFFVVPFIFFYLLLFFKTNKNGKRNIFLYSVLFAVIIAVVWTLVMNVESLYNAIGVRMEDLFKTFAGEEGDSSAEIREIIRNLAFDRWLERPLLGYGFDSFKYYAQSTVGHFYYSHCNYTELLYSGGIGYFFLFYWIFYRILRNAFANRRIPVAYKAFAVATVVSLFIFDYGAVTYNLTPTLIMLMMAYTASNFARGETENNEQTANTDADAEV